MTFAHEFIALRDLGARLTDRHADGWTVVTLLPAAAYIEPDRTDARLLAVFSRDED